MRIRCYGYTDDNLTSLDKLMEIMVGVESGEVERPEIELVEEGSPEELVALIAALFREQEGV